MRQGSYRKTPAKARALRAEVRTMFRKILVPLDGSQTAEAILPQVLEFAHALGAGVILLRIAYAHPFRDVDAIYHFAEEEARVMREAETYLAAVADRLAKKEVGIETTVRYAESVAAIIEQVAAERAALVAMSTHGRGGIRRLVLGSVTEEIVRKGKVPLLLLRAEEGQLKKEGETPGSISLLSRGQASQGGR